MKSHSTCAGRALLWTCEENIHAAIRTIGKRQHIASRYHLATAELTDATAHLQFSSPLIRLIPPCFLAHKKGNNPCLNAKGLAGCKIGLMLRNAWSYCFDRGETSPYNSLRHWDTAICSRYKRDIYSHLGAVVKILSFVRSNLLKAVDFVWLTSHLAWAGTAQKAVFLMA